MARARQWPHGGVPRARSVTPFLAPQLPGKTWVTAHRPLTVRQLSSFSHRLSSGAGHQRKHRDESARIDAHEYIASAADLRRTVTDRLDRRSQGRKEYNREAGKHGYVCLDRAFIKTDLHPCGFESCDLFGPSNELVHVKRAKSTAPLNHLFAQGRVSADALRWDSTARSKASPRQGSGTRSTRWKITLCPGR